MYEASSPMTNPFVLPTLLRDAAERDAGHPALVLDGEQLSYGELDALSNRIARSLLRYRIQPEDRIALWFDRSLEGIAALWGVLKACAAYVPIDAKAPASRMAAIARNCRVAALVTTSNRVAQVEQAFGGDPPMRAIWLIDSSMPAAATRTPLVPWSEIVNEGADAPSIAVDSDALASIHYTSGSTGEPKGVMTAHGPLLAKAQWSTRVFGLTAQDRLLGYTPIQSAMSTFEIFAGAAAGATTFLVPTRVGPFPAAIAKSSSEQRLTLWYIVPSALVMLLTRGNLAACDFSSLRMIGFGGEPLPMRRLRELMELLPWVRFVHVYGRTEVKSRSFHEIRFPPSELDMRTIGRTSPDCGMHVLDDELHPVSDGKIGELWFSGPVLMRGYWELPELTAEVMRTIELAPGQRLRACRTGDLVKRHPDGTLELVGRADQQVKLRGYRVEIGEVERTLNRHPAVANAIAIVEEGGAAGHRLRALIMLRPGSAVDERELREHCSATLPRYMIPDQFEFRGELPISANGKVDRRALGFAGRPVVRSKNRQK
jgi:amino acid adenylation domain-containing protein